MALDQETQEVVFVEVKARSSSQFGEPSLAVGQRKLRSLIKVAEIYLKQKKLMYDYRFDIITIVCAPQAQINHYRNVTWEMVK